MLTPSLLLVISIWINLWPDVAMAQGKLANVTHNSYDRPNFDPGLKMSKISKFGGKMLQITNFVYICIVHQSIAWIKM